MAESEDILTPAEMREWLDHEMRDLKRECQLREKDFTDFVTAYEAGRITPAEADARFTQYYKRWGEAFRGMINTTDQMSDEEVLKRFDNARERLRDSTRHFSRGR